MVIIIIGILAAIAIPVFLNQRKKAVQASLRSDARTVANEEESYYTDNQSYFAVASLTGGPVSIGPDSVALSSGNQVKVTLNGSGGAGTYCIDVYNANSAPTDVYYDSGSGGLLPTGTHCT